MKLLLTSAGIENLSIHDAPIKLVVKPIADFSALCIPTAGHGDFRDDWAANAWRFISGHEPECPLCELSWKSPGALELTALPGMGAERWDPADTEYATTGCVAHLER